jgi:hypothetical protein
MTFREHGHLLLGFHLGTRQALATAWRIPDAALDAAAPHIRQYIHETPVYSWLPPPDVAASPDIREDIVEQADAAVLTWFKSARHWLWNPPPIANVEADMAVRHAAREQERIARRRNEILRHPFAVTQDGIFVANFLGSHEEWLRALDHAMVVATEGVTGINNLPDGTRTAEMLAKWIKGVWTGLQHRYERFVVVARVRTATGRRALAPDTLSMAKRLMRGMTADARMSEFYVLQGLPDTDLVEHQFRDLWTKWHIWVAALKRLPIAEIDAWIEPWACDEFLRLWDRGYVFLFEMFYGLGHPMDALAYAGKRLVPTSTTRGYPAGFGFGMRRQYAGNTYRFQSSDGLFHTLLHEIAHVLQYFSPRIGKRRPMHGVEFQRAMQFTVNVAVLAGLVDAQYKFDNVLGNGTAPLFPGQWALDKIPSVKQTADELRAELQHAGHKRAPPAALPATSAPAAKRARTRPPDAATTDAAYLALVGDYVRAPVPLTRADVAHLDAYYRAHGQRQQWMAELAAHETHVACADHCYYQ